MNTTNTATVAAATAPDQFDYHTNPTPKFPCEVCGCPAGVRARHRALTASEAFGYSAGVQWVKSVSKCFGTMREDVAIKG